MHSIIITGYWKDAVNEPWTKEAAIGEYKEDDDDDDIFYWFDNIESVVGTHDDFVVTEMIQEEKATHFFRVIVYWNQYSSDQGRYSDTSTTINVIGKVFKEIPSNQEMIQLANDTEWIDGLASRSFITPRCPPYQRNQIQMVSCTPVFKKESYGELVQAYLGVAKVAIQDSVAPKYGPSDIFSVEQLSEACNYQEFDIYDIGVDEKDNNVIIIDGHNFDDMWKLHGYDSEESLKKMDYEICGFNDDSFRCSKCDVIMSNIDGMAYNVRYKEDGPIGISCGCYDDYCVENVEEFLNNSSDPMPPGALEKLKEKGLATHHSDLCNGWSCGDDCPEKLIESLFDLARIGGFDLVEDATDEGEGIIFSLDWCGQFDTGFSMWIYRDRKKTALELLHLAKDGLVSRYIMDEEDNLVLINSEHAPNYFDSCFEEEEYRMWKIVIEHPDETVELVEGSDEVGSEYNAVRDLLIYMDEWEY